MKILLANNSGYKWHYMKTACFSLYTKGYAFLKNKLYKEEEFLEIIDKILTDDGGETYLLDSLNELNGCFSIVVYNEERIIAVSDRFRSFPILYSINDEFVITDDCTKLPDFILRTGLDIQAIEEYKAFGYVTGEDTLLKPVKQLMAGQYIIYDIAKHNIQKKYYYEFGYNRNPEIADMRLDEKLAKLDSILIEAGKRMIEYLDGRTAVLSLSGGQDSRLIAIILKRLHYENVITFCFGKRDNVEVEKSKHVADALGFRWIFIEYTSSDWEPILKNADADGYYSYAGNLTSVAHMAAYIAVDNMKNKNLIPADSVFINGGRYDAATGSWTSAYYILHSGVRTSSLISGLFERHAVNSHLSKINQKCIINKTIEVKEKFVDCNRAIGEEYRWGSSERHAKFIRNTNRVYEYFGYQWFSPLEDKELYDFWQMVDKDDYWKRKLHYQYASKYMAPYVDIYDKVPVVKKSIKDNIVVRRLYSHFFVFFRKFKKKKLVLQYNSPVSTLSCFSEDELLSLAAEYKGFLNGNRYNEEHYLQLLKKLISES